MPNGPIVLLTGASGYLRDKIYIAILSNIWHLDLDSIRDGIYDIYKK